MGELNVKAVLVVDTDPQLALTTVAQLGANGYTADVAASLPEVLSRCESREYCAIITDLMGPGLGGAALMCEVLQKQPNARLIVARSAEFDVLPLGSGLSGIILPRPWSEEQLLDALQGRVPVSGAPPEPPLRLLVVEDNETDAVLLETGLRLACPGAFHIRRVASLKEAGQVLASEDVDAVTLDLDLPDAFGLSALARLQAVAASTAVVVVSACNDERVAMQAIQSGAQDFLVKGRVGGAGLAKAIRYARERKRTEVRLLDLGRKDPLTGSANRSSFRQQLSLAIAHAERCRQSFGLLLVDLDHFKQVNDALGHAAGDVLLRQVAERLSGSCSATDTVARLGGDEFALLLLKASDEQRLYAQADVVVRALQTPVVLPGATLGLTASVGGCCYVAGAGLDAEGLMAAADAAMYSAKKQGRNRFSAHPSVYRPRRSEPPLPA